MNNYNQDKRLKYLEDKMESIMKKNMTLNQEVAELKNTINNYENEIYQYRKDIVNLFNNEKESNYISKDMYLFMYQYIKQIDNKIDLYILKNNNYIYNTILKDLIELKSNIEQVSTSFDNRFINIENILEAINDINIENNLNIANFQALDLDAIRKDLESKLYTNDKNKNNKNIYNNEMIIDDNKNINKTEDDTLAEIKKNIRKHIIITDKKSFTKVKDVLDLYEIDVEVNIFSEKNNFYDYETLFARVIESIRKKCSSEFENILMKGKYIFKDKPSTLPDNFKLISLKDICGEFITGDDIYMFIPNNDIDTISVILDIIEDIEFKEDKIKLSFTFIDKNTDTYIDRKTNTKNTIENIHKNNSNDINNNEININKDEFINEVIKDGYTVKAQCKKYNLPEKDIYNLRKKWGLTYNINELKELGNSQLENIAYKGFKNTIPLQIYFNDDLIEEVKTWKDLYIKACNYLMKLNKENFKNAIYEIKKSHSYTFYKNPTYLNKPVYLEDIDLYTETALSAQYICQILTLIVKHMNLEPDMIFVEFVSKQKSIEIKKEA